MRQVCDKLLGECIDGATWLALSEEELKEELELTLGHRKRLLAARSRAQGDGAASSAAGEARARSADSSLATLGYETHHGVVQSSARAGLQERRWQIDFTELEVVRGLGEGMFGVVELAHWRGADVAVKRMRVNEASHPCGASSEEMSKEVCAFVAEAQLMLAMQPHPNVV